jgi:hypothetical protein
MHGNTVETRGSGIVPVLVWGLLFRGGAGGLHGNLKDGQAKATGRKSGVGERTLAGFHLLLPNPYKVINMPSYHGLTTS